MIILKSLLATMNIFRMVSAMSVVFWKNETSGAYSLRLMIPSLAASVFTFSKSDWQSAKTS
jgi:hypothetical protein